MLCRIIPYFTVISCDAPHLCQRRILHVNGFRCKSLQDRGRVPSVVLHQRFLQFWQSFFFNPRRFAPKQHVAGVVRLLPSQYLSQEIIFYFHYITISAHISMQVRCSVCVVYCIVYCSVLFSVLCSLLCSVLRSLLCSVRCSVRCSVLYSVLFSVLCSVLRNGCVLYCVVHYLVPTTVYCTV